VASRGRPFTFGTKRWAVALSLLIVFYLPGCAFAAGSNESAQTFLEGLWLIDQKPVDNACLSHGYRADQFEFEFEKSGGRLSIFEPPDLFTDLAISGVEQKDDSILINGRTRGGKSAPLLRLKRTGVDSFELLPEAEGGKAKAQTAYRCARPDRVVTQAVPATALALLTPNLSGSQGFVEIKPGEDERAVCRGGGSAVEPRGWLQFDVLGPVHYWLMGQSPAQGRGFDFDLIQSVRMADARTLVLSMSERAKNGEGWRASADPRKQYVLTVIDKGGRIDIPELSASFARCNADEAGSLGMHRG